MIFEPYLYNMNMSINFLLQSTRVLHIGNYDNDELSMIFNYINAIDESLIEDLENNSSILGYKNDLELYHEIIDALVKIYEEREEYEKCELLIKKKLNKK